jgi:hypothetical protein
MRLGFRGSSKGSWSRRRGVELVVAAYPLVESSGVAMWLTRRVGSSAARLGMHASPPPVVPSRAQERVSAVRPDAEGKMVRKMEGVWLAWDPQVKERGKQKRDRCLLGCGSIRPNGPLHCAAR